MTRDTTVRQKASGRVRHAKEADLASSIEPELTFQALDEKIEAAVQDVPNAATPRSHKWLLGLGIAGTALGLLLGQFGRGQIPDSTLLVLVVGCLVAELIGFVSLVVIQVPGGLRHVMKANSYHALSMDRALLKHAEIIAWLSQFPAEHRQSRLRFSRRLNEMMGRRLALIIGGIQRLGVLPLIVAFYLQFKDMDGDWSNVFDVGYLNAIIIAMIVMLYSIGWMAALVRLRMDLVENVLDESLVERR